MDDGHSGGLNQAGSRAVSFCLTGLSIAVLAAAAIAASAALWLAIWAVL